VTRVAGHALLAEGAAFNRDGQRVTMNTTAGSGHARCQCGAQSEALRSSGERRRWHVAHKAEVSK
jgi:hypothetical protein